MMGLKSDDSQNDTITQRIDRISGLMMFYAAILQSPLPPAFASNPAAVPYPFQLPRLWTWLARVTNDPGLMRDRASPHVLAAVIEAAGDCAADAWGKQIIKFRRVLGRKALEKDGDANSLLGGQEGSAGRVRLGVILEKWEMQGKIEPKGREMN